MSNFEVATLQFDSIRNPDPICSENKEDDNEHRKKKKLQPLLFLKCKTRLLKGVPTLSVTVHEEHKLWKIIVVRNNDRQVRHRIAAFVWYDMKRQW